MLTVKADTPALNVEQLQERFLIENLRKLEKSGAAFMMQHLHKIHTQTCMFMTQKKIWYACILLKETCWP